MRENPGLWYSGPKAESTVLTEEPLNRMTAGHTCPFITSYIMHKAVTHCCSWDTSSRRCTPQHAWTHLQDMPAKAPRDIS